MTVGCTPAPQIRTVFVPQPRLPAPTPKPVASESAQPSRKIAVLPIDDDELFRNERMVVRTQLYNALRTRVAPHKLVPLPKVDKALLPVTEGGERCAFQQRDAQAAAQHRNWATTSLSHVFGFKGSPEKLWVDIRIRGSNLAQFAGIYQPKLPPLERYRQVFAVLTPNSGAMVLGALSGRGGPSKSVTLNGVTLCEQQTFGSCNRAASLPWKDTLPQMDQCFSTPETSVKVLLANDKPQTRCEIVDLNETGGAMGQLEKCLCAPLMKSSALGAQRKRRTLRIRHSNEKYNGKPRPQLRVIESSTNIRIRSDYHQPRNRITNQNLAAVRRGYIDNLDAAALPLSTCNAPESTIITAELMLSGTGHVQSAKLLGFAGNDALAKCTKAALTQGAFDCSSNSKAARLRISIEWPKWPAKK